MSCATDNETDFPTELAPTTEESKAIKAIGKDSVHRICSGQVVLSLAVAVKELVENSIDAGATLIEVKLKDQGLESLQVSDNGCGVEEHNLEGMTAKYHTSKIREFVDLQHVETFGFRGEALSSLCALSDMSIVTRHSSTAVAVRLDLDHEGKIKKRSPCAGPVGTTVTLTNLFGTLPVRKREFQRNIKKEFTKMCHILYAYGLVSKGVRIVGTNQSAKGGKTVFMKTFGVQSVMDNIEAIFGARQTADIVELTTPLLGSVGGAEQEKNKHSETLADGDDGDDSCQPLSSEELRVAEQFKLEGLVSSCMHGAGRSSRDRQYFYINSRPCDPKNVIKLVNEVYHRYNSQQYPFIYLNVLTRLSDVDVNLTPDKRQLLINNEKILLLVIKKSLIKAFCNIPSTFKVQNSGISKMLNAGKEPVKEYNNVEKGTSGVDDNLVPITSAKRFLDVLSQWKRTGDTKGAAPPAKTTKRKCDDEIEVRTLKLKKIQEYLTKEDHNSKTKEFSCASESDTDNEDKANESSSTNLETSLLNAGQIKKQSEEFDILTRNEDAAGNCSTIVERIDCKVLPPPKPSYRQLTFVQDSCDSLALTPLLQPARSNSYSPEKDSENDDDDNGDRGDDDGTVSLGLEIGKTILLDDSSSDDDINLNATHSGYEIHCSIAEIEESLKAEEELGNEKQNRYRLDRLRFKSEINPTQNSNAEQELQREISKDMFSKMEIIGQFNLGFIVVKLDADLFIVDQHATDEKYNFETLQQNFVMQHQPLAVPQTLDLTAVNEMILLDHLEVFHKNGFKFSIQENAPPTKKIQLLSKPVSKNWEFGKDDIDELIFMLQDAPEGTMCRPSRIRTMLASRACRKSVMIGKALNRATMKLLVTHMGEIEQPWNCPHGRPTMRHLINVSMLNEIDEESTQ